MKNKIIIGLIVGVFALVGLGVYKYLNKPHRNVLESKVDIALNAVEILTDFQNNSSQANQKYLNKIIVVSGEVINQESDNVTIDPGVTCYFLVSNDEELFGELKIKGRCIGYDELLEVVKLDQCTLIKN